MPILPLQAPESVVHSIETVSQPRRRALLVTETVVVAISFVMDHVVVHMDILIMMI